jgi:haloalkane dehalogenase
VKTLRTPEERFKDLEGFAFEPHYAGIPDGAGGELRVHCVDEGPRGSEVVLLMHGEPSWCYLYRRMIPILRGAGLRVVAPDLVGFGRSDKPAAAGDYTYARHVEWMQAWLARVGLERITLVCQDWGGLIGLRLVADDPDRFCRVVAANTGLPTGDRPVSEAFLKWRRFSVETADFDVGAIVAMGCRKPLAEGAEAAYNAPFPDDRYKAGARIFPSLVPIAADDPAAPANRRAWEALSRFAKPFLTAFSDADPITAGGERIFQRMVPGARGQPHATIKGGGHFLQEDCGEELAGVVVDFISRNPL